MSKLIQLTTALDARSMSFTDKPALIEGVLPDDAPIVAMIAGPAKIGKSWMTLDLALEFARGGYWLGHKCTKGQVVYVNLDSSHATFSRRVKILSSELGLTDDEMLNFLYYTDESQKVSDLVNDMIYSFAKNPPKLVIIDSLYNCYFDENFKAYDENDSGDANQFMNQLKKLSRALNCAVIVIHHFRKGVEYGTEAMDNISGSGVFSRAVDAIITMTRTSVNKETRANIVAAAEVRGITIDPEDDIKAASIDIKPKHFDEHISQTAYMLNGVWHLNNGLFVRGKAGRPEKNKAQEKAEKETFDRTYDAILAREGKVKIADMCAEMNLSINTVKTRCDAYGYAREYGIINRA